MLVSDFDYDLPPHLIAQTPAADRSASRLMVLDRKTGSVETGVAANLPRWLHPGDLLVVNDTRVFPARLVGHRVPSGGAVECLLLRRLDDARWDALVHPGQKLKPGRRFRCEGLGGVIDGEVLAQHTFGRRTVRLWAPDGGDLDRMIDAIGHVPLPPYIRRSETPEDRERYQTVFARARGSVAAPTAGLHFTPALLEALDRRRVERLAITLHVGYGTFKPVRTEAVEDHRVDAEPYIIDEASARAVNRALDEHRRVIAVGTTTTRALESAAMRGNGRLTAARDETSLFISPGFAFQVVSGLLTNFHLPRSSLLFLVCAFAGRDETLAAYRRAVEEGFRFYSYGDAMLIV
ncbi:MAG: tRNA preQ1(34) S-adenosylmethionine ribosyltransferase-isomerase QueA [Luteitalea sp.]|nr:tRNA preQ1(34) S-adenosylmethionine ribosyltransferase-isomerase QueA [Luteitalea sp.]